MGERRPPPPGWSEAGEAAPSSHGVTLACGGPAGSGVTLEPAAGVQERKGGWGGLKPGLRSQEALHEC